VEPFLKVTVPVGEAPVTFAVKVTLDPTANEVGEAVRAVVVDPAVTVTVAALEVEPVFRASPP
jgi:hypothetical protein